MFSMESKRRVSPGKRNIRSANRDPTRRGGNPDSVSPKERLPERILSSMPVAPSPRASTSMP
jgi:hypothetical protein